MLGVNYNYRVIENDRCALYGIGGVNMSKVLVVVDMQNDFVDGSLGSVQAFGIVSRVRKKIEKCIEMGDGLVFTMDTHDVDYLKTMEGENLPVKHCIKGTDGWNIVKELAVFLPGNKEDVHKKESKKKHADSKQEVTIDTKKVKVVEKNTFGSLELPKFVKNYNEIELVGLCTDICVISNAILLKTFYPEKIIEVDASCCAGSTPESHDNAISAMKACQIKILREKTTDKWRI